jgi:hypothetical protein
MYNKMVGDKFDLDIADRLSAEVISPTPPGHATAIPSEMSKKKETVHSETTETMQYRHVTSRLSNQLGISYPLAR